MERAAFKLSSYHFTKASMNFDIPQNSELDVAFRPKGHYVQHLGTYKLTFDTVIVCQAVHSEVINVSCEAEFTFNDLLKKEEIPSFFSE